MGRLEGNRKKEPRLTHSALPFAEAQVLRGVCCEPRSVVCAAAAAGQAGSAPGPPSGWGRADGQGSKKPGGSTQEEMHWGLGAAQLYGLQKENSLDPQEVVTTVGGASQPASQGRGVPS